MQILFHSQFQYTPSPCIVRHACWFYYNANKAQEYLKKKHISPTVSVAERSRALFRFPVETYFHVELFTCFPFLTARRSPYKKSSMTFIKINGCVLKIWRRYIWRHVSFKAHCRLYLSLWTFVREANTFCIFYFQFMTAKSRKYQVMFKVHSPEK